MPRPAENIARDPSSTDLPHRDDPLQPDPDADAVWRIAAGLDLESRSVIEAEVLLWRICAAKSLPQDAVRRVLF
jgi:hypothetical protein